MSHQLRYYKYLFGDYLDFVIIDAPHETKPVFDITVKKLFNEPFYSWYYFKEKTGE